MDEREFKNLVERYQQGQINEQERQRLDLWLDLLGKDQELVVADKAIGEEIKRALFEQINKSKSRKFVPTWVRIAATLLLLVSASIAVWQWRSIDIVYIVTQTQRQKVTLPDGSIIWLKENSNLSYPERFIGEQRQVQFMGEALFEVAKDKAHPFIIESGKVVATVLGTSFNLKVTSEDVDLTVLTGKVGLTAVDTKASLVIKANEHASYKLQEQVITRSEVIPQEALRVVEHTDYDMNFENVTLGEIAKRIEGKFDVSLKMNNPSMKSCVVTGNFTDHSLDETLRMIAATLGLQYEVHGKEVKLIGEGCR